VDELRRDLWKDLRSELLAMHETVEGKDLIRFWKFEKFSEPSNQYEQSIRDATQNTSIDELLSARSARK
jgi:hypothetical protein